MFNKNLFIADPLEYFSIEIVEKIFSYVPLKDLMTASLASTAWYSYIASSKNIMRRVKIKITCSRLPSIDAGYWKKIINAIIGSERNYEALEIESCPQCIDSIFNLLSNRKWKHIALANTCFSTAEQSLQFFSLIQENVETLNMNAVYVRYPYSNGLNNGLIFPNLESLTAKNTQAFLFPEILQNIQHLKHFDLFSSDQNVASLNVVMKFLKKNNKLESLNISGRVLYQIFYENISLTVPFKLKKLSISNGNRQVGPFYERTYENFAALLNQQAASLETVLIDDWMGEDILKTIYRLPKLKEVTIKKFTHFDTKLSKLNLPTNTSVRKMHLSMAPDDLDILKAMVKGAPNLITFSISLMNIHFMELVSENCRFLKDLTVGYLNLTHISKNDYFRNLEELDIKNYRSCLRESIVRKSFQTLNNFERMLFFIMID